MSKMMECLNFTDRSTVSFTHALDLQKNSSFDVKRSHLSITDKLETQYQTALS